LRRQAKETLPGNPAKMLRPYFFIWRGGGLMVVGFCPMVYPGWRVKLFPMKKPATNREIDNENVVESPRI
jgi:hypothetical protein